MCALEPEELEFQHVSLPGDAAHLVELARGGDLEAFGKLVELTTPACYSLAFRLMGNEHDARDVVQDAYLRAFGGLRRFRGEATFSTWLHRITVNCATTHLTRRARSSHDRLDDLDDADYSLAFVDPEVAQRSTLDRDRITKALAELPDQLRLVVVLRDVYDLPHREIARELGITQSAAKVRLHRARRRLRDRLFVSQAARLDPRKEEIGTGSVSSMGYAVEGSSGR